MFYVLKFQKLLFFETLQLLNETNHQQYTLQATIVLSQCVTFSGARNGGAGEVAVSPSLAKFGICCMALYEKIN